MMPRRVSHNPSPCVRRILPSVRQVHRGRRYSHQKVEPKGFDELKQIIVANKSELNNKNALGRTSFYYIVDQLPEIDVSTKTIENVFVCMLENNARLHEEQFLHGSAHSHLMHKKGSNAVFLANLILDYGLIDINKVNLRNVSPLKETTEVMLKKDHFSHHRCLVNLFKKGVKINRKDYPQGLPYHDFLSVKYSTESALKNLYLTLFLFTRYEKSTLNSLDESGQTPLDLTHFIDANLFWKNAVITLLIEKGAHARKYPLPKFKHFHPTLGDFYDAVGVNSGHYFNRLLH